MLIRFTIPNDYGSKDDFDRLIEIVADWLDVTRDDIDESDIWQYLFSKLPSGSNLVESDEFSQVWAVPSDVDVDGFWKTVITDDDQDRVHQERLTDAVNNLVERLRPMNGLEVKAVLDFIATWPGARCLRSIGYGNGIEIGWAEIVALAVIMSELDSNEDVYNVCRQIMTKLLDVEIEPET